MVRSVALLAITAAAKSNVTFPKEYAAVMTIQLPYIDFRMPLRVLTTESDQRVEYYNGLQVENSNATGTWKYVYNNSERACMFSPATSGPTLGDDKWSPTNYFPDLSAYTRSEDELVGGIMCHKYVASKKHGKTGTMDDRISFYWDPVLETPVRWHMHSRFKVQDSHTDEWIVDYLSLQAGKPTDWEVSAPQTCAEATVTDMSLQAKHLLSAAHSLDSRLAEEDASFEAFALRHGKIYAPEEHLRRKDIYQKNLEIIKELNQKHAGTTKFTGNRFLDMTKNEVLRLRRRRQQRHERRSPDHLSLVRTHDASNKELPKDIDWRTEKPGVVGPVKDQGMCGSCWTYGVTEPAESMHAIQTGKLVELSEQFVVDCTWTNATGASGGNFGCDGGDSDIGALEIIRKFGGVLPTARAYGSYLSVNGFCKDTRVMETGAKLTGWVDIKMRDEKALMEALATKGPVNVNIMVPDEMVYYDSGVLQVDTCKYSEDDIDHAVVAVGYGTDEHGVDYWTIRNSWSTYWGDAGYIRIARGNNDCCVACEAGYPELAATIAVVV